jgi:subtilisin family serine protease
MRSLNLRRAYTITELVIVIAIILLVVSLSSYALMSARKAADGIVSDAEAALQSGLVAKAALKKARPVQSHPLAFTPIPDQYIVVFDNSVTDPNGKAQFLAQNYPLTILHVYKSGLSGFSATIPPGSLAALKNDPAVAYIEQDTWITVAAQKIPTGIRRIGATQSSVAPGSQKVPAIGNMPLQKLPQPSPLDLAKGGGTKFGVNVVVAVIDTGIDATHPDLNVEFTKGFGFPDAVDANGHGTHVAGTIGAYDNNIGVVGVAPGARLWALKVLDASGLGTNANLIAALDYVAAHYTQIAVVNVSVAVASSQALNAAATKCVNLGVVTVAAAGNNKKDASGFSPASAPGVICVAAYADSDGLPGGKGPAVSTGEKDDTFATSFSNFGNRVDVIAPGCDILSTFPVSMGSYATITKGTSTAAAHVSGLAAVIRDPDVRKSGGILDLRSPLNSPGFSPATVLQLMLQNSSRLVPGPGNRSYPLINAMPF